MQFISRSLSKHLFDFLFFFFVFFIFARLINIISSFLFFETIVLSFCFFRLVHRFDTILTCLFSQHSSLFCRHFNHSRYLFCFLRQFSLWSQQFKKVMFVVYSSTNSKMILRSRSSRDLASSFVADFLAFQAIFVYLKLSVFLYVLLCSLQAFCQNSFRKIVNFDNDTRNVKIDRSCSCASKAMISSMRVWFHQHLIHTIFSHQSVLSYFDFHQVFHDDFYQDFHQDFH